MPSVSGDVTHVLGQLAVTGRLTTWMVRSAGLTLVIFIMETGSLMSFAPDSIISSFGVAKYQ